MVTWLDDVKCEYIETWEENYSDFASTLKIESKTDIIRLDKSQIQQLKEFLDRVHV